MGRLAIVCLSLLIPSFLAVAEFASKLGGVYDKFAGELKLLVKTFRRKNEDLKKER